MMGLIGWFWNAPAPGVLAQGLVALVAAVWLALVIDAWIGEPPPRWHPVVWMGRYLTHAGAWLQAQVRRICKLEHHELVVTSSIGIAMYPEDGGDFETLAQRADAAMFRAKESGRDTYRFFSADMQARSLRVLQIENALRSALVLGQLTLHYQPQIRLKDRRLVGWRPCCAGRTPSWALSVRPNSSRWQRAVARFWASVNGCCALRWPRPGSGVMQAIPSWWWR